MVTPGGPLGRGGPLRTLVVSDLHFGTHAGTDVLRDRRRAGAVAGGARAAVTASSCSATCSSCATGRCTRRWPPPASRWARSARARARGRGRPARRQPRPLPGAPVEPAARRRRPAARAGARDGGRLAGRGPARRPWRRCSRPRGCARPIRGCGCAPDVWASHGHYLDVHMTVPSIERLGAGVMRRIVSAPGARIRRSRPPPPPRTTRRSSRPSTPGCTRWPRARRRGADAGCRAGRCGAGRR